MWERKHGSVAFRTCPWACAPTGIEREPPGMCPEWGWNHPASGAALVASRTALQAIPLAGLGDGAHFWG